MIESSDFFFPYTVYDYKTLYGGILFMSIIFHDVLFKAANFSLPKNFFLPDNS